MAEIEQFTGFRSATAWAVVLSVSVPALPAAERVKPVASVARCADRETITRATAPELRVHTAWDPRERRN